MKGFGAKIIKAREEMGLKQTEVAAQIPMNQSNYSKIERDLQEPSLEQLQRICRILELDCNFLLELDDFEEISTKDIELLKDIKNLMRKYY